MSLRSTILRHSLPLLPTHSFTRQTLTNALSHLPSSHPDHRPNQLPESVIDTLFGTTELSAGKALVAEWENAGREYMSESHEGRGNIHGVLAKRLEWSSKINENLLEAYALLSSPESSTSLPIPRIPSSIQSLIPSNLITTLPLIYSSLSSKVVSKRNLAILLATLASTNRTSDHLPLITVNPLGALGYAWRIADQAVNVCEKGQPIKVGVMNEPLGAGPEWYTTRIGLSLVYLAAESHLLQPYPPTLEHSDVPTINPNLPAALASLSKNLKRHEEITNTIEQSEKGMGEMIGLLEYAGKSLKGYVQSRGL